MITIALTALALAAAHITVTIIGTFLLVALLERFEPKPKSQI